MPKILTYYNILLTIIPKKVQKLCVFSTLQNILAYIFVQLFVVCYEMIEILIEMLSNKRQHLTYLVPWSRNIIE